MSVADDKGAPVFLHTILPGGASHSFGVAVAKLAGVPEEVVKNAQQILEKLEKEKINISPVILNNVKNHYTDPKQINSSFSLPQTQNINLIDKLIHKDLEKLDISRMTPLEALNKLAELKEKLNVYELETEQLNEID